MKALSLISSGIDSPVATFLMQKKIKVDGIFFYQGRFSDEISKDKVLKLAKKIGLKKLYMIDYELIQKQLVEKCRRRLTCVLCKRFMYILAQAVAKQQGYDYLITGENLGQVASQTLDNLYVNDSAVDIFVMRPLIGYDKQEIIEIAKKIGTYEISIIKTVGCLALPKCPATTSKLAVVMQEEKKVDIAPALDTLKAIQIT